MLVLMLTFSSSCSVDLSNEENFRASIKSEKRKLQKIAGKRTNEYSKKHSHLAKKMLQNVQELDFNEDFIFGKDRKYLKKGMHRHFSSPPQKLKTYFKRNPKVIQLEEDHVDLYYIDYNLHVWESLSQIWANQELDNASINDSSSLTRRGIKKLLIKKGLKALQKQYPKVLEYTDIIKEKPFVE